MPSVISHGQRQCIAKILAIHHDNQIKLRQIPRRQQPGPTEKLEAPLFSRLAHSLIGHLANVI
jgi:hypothetical protein